MESFNDPLAKLRALAEKPVESEKLETKSISIGRMEEFRDALKSRDFYERVILGKFIDYSGRVRNAGDYKKKSLIEFDKIDKNYLHMLAEEENLVQDFLNARENLDSNSKKKLWEKIYKEDWLPKLESIFQSFRQELDAFELNRKSRHMEKGEPAQLTEDQEDILRNSGAFIDDRRTIKNWVENLATGLQTLKKLGLDSEKLKELEDRFKKVKK